MIFDPTDFDGPAAPPRNWLGRLLGNRGRRRTTPASDLPPHLLDDIGISRALVDVTLRHRR